MGGPVRITTLGRGLDLVLLHGWAMDSRIWQALSDQLSQRFRLTLVDLPGHGTSAPSDDWSLQNLTTQVLSCVPLRAHWLCWSMGGLLGQHIARVAADRVMGLHLVASTPSFVQRRQWPNAMPGEVWDRFVQDFQADPDGAWQRFLALQVHGTEDARTRVREMKRLVGSRPPPYGPCLVRALDFMAHMDLRQTWSDLQVPVRVLLGGKDSLIPVQVKHDLQRLLPGVTVKQIPRAGHAPFLSHQPEFLDWVYAIEN